MLRQRELDFLEGATVGDSEQEAARDGSQGRRTTPQRDDGYFSNSGADAAGTRVSQSEFAELNARDGRRCDDVGGGGDTEARRICREDEVSGSAVAAAEVANRAQFLGPRFGVAVRDVGYIPVSRRVDAVESRTMWCEWQS